MDPASNEIRDLTSLARECVQIGPAPNWVIPCPYNSDFAPTSRGPLTCLLIEQQVQADLRQTYVRTAQRLETMQAIQQQSNWRLAFEPQTQSIILHSIKVRRGSLEVEHLSLERLQFLQREAGLEGLVISGWVTILLLLEDVCPGDVLEWSYTLTNRPKLLPDNISCFFTLPPGFEIGKYHFSIRHREGRDLQWKSSSPELAPTRELESGEVCYALRGEKMSVPAIEDSTPSSYLAFPWIQMSDCADWQTVARAVTEAWKEEPTGDGMAKLLEEINRVDTNLLARINRAIELVQDGFRYLSVNLELGGQIPASAETVVRRRYGDCKDMAFLLVRILRALGVRSRPILVHTAWRSSIAEMLPSPSVFNHVVVEYEIENERRWVDATLKQQGGNALHRGVPDFAFGLPIDRDTNALSAIPKESLPSGSIHVKESFILDTSGGASLLALVILAKGIQAEAFRAEFANEGIEAVAKKRLQACANRFSNATRIGQLQYRDDRELNEFAIADTFEIKGFLRRDPNSKTCLFLVRGEAAPPNFVCPSPTARRSPIAEPFPCRRTHVVEIDFSGMRTINVPMFETGNEFFSFSRRTKALPKFLWVTFAFNALADSVPAKRIQEHRKSVASVWEASRLELRFPLGVSRGRRRSDFGALPGVSATNVASQPLAAQSSDKAPAIPTPSVIQPVVFSQPEVPFYLDYRAGINKKCLASLYILLTAIIASGFGAFISRTPGNGVLVVLIFLGVTCIVLTALTMAAIGWRECVRQPQFYRRGKAVAITTMILGVIFGIILIPCMIAGVVMIVNEANVHNDVAPPARAPELLRYDKWGFVFHPPGPPWQQVDATKIGRRNILAFRRPGPIHFVVSALRIKPGSTNVTERWIAASKASLRKENTSDIIISEGAATYNGTPGWQVEAEASVQGHDNYIVNWLLTTNGIAYQLAAWAPVKLGPRVKVEASMLFSKFELRVPEPFSQSVASTNKSKID
jgi:MFS family permease